MQVNLLEMVVGASFDSSEVLEDPSLLEWHQFDVADPLESLAQVVVCEEVCTNQSFCSVRKRFAWACVQTAAWTLQWDVPVLGLRISHDSHKPMHTQIVVPNPEDVEIGYEHDFSVLNVTLPSFWIFSLEPICKQSCSELQNCVTVGF